MVMFCCPGARAGRARGSVQTPTVRRQTGRCQGQSSHFGGRGSPAAQGHGTIPADKLPQPVAPKAVKVGSQSTFTTDHARRSGVMTCRITWPSIIRSEFFLRNQPIFE